MAHAAELDDNNCVIRVVVISNDYEPNIEQFATELFGGVWKQTSYNGTIRKNYAGIGFIYDAERDAFIAPKPYNSWLLNEDTCVWNAPNPMPTDGKPYTWDEPTLAWVEVELPA
jgi:hypothetical protein